MSKAQQDILNRYRKTAIIGAGVIGASWTALFLAHGLEQFIASFEWFEEQTVHALT